MINEVDCSDAIRNRAKALYEAYIQNSDGLNFRGEPCPPWDLLTPAVRSHWCATALEARSEIRAHVNEKFQHMKARPEMFARTKESFAVQLETLAELTLLPLGDTNGVSPISELRRLLFGPGAIVPVAQLDALWAKQAVEATWRFIEERWQR